MRVKMDVHRPLDLCHTEGWNPDGFSVLYRLIVSG